MIKCTIIIREQSQQPIISTPRHPDLLWWLGTRIGQDAVQRALMLDECEAVIRQLADGVELQ